MAARGALRTFLDERRARLCLRQCDEVGADPRVEGWPTVVSEGAIRIGRSFRLASRPAPSHLRTGPGALLEIGDNVSIGHGAGIAVFAGLRIGSGTLIAPFAAIMDTDFHIVGKRELHAPPEPISIGARVRIGANVTILHGSTVEDGAVIDPGSVVTGKVAAGSRVGGVPAREAAGQLAVATESLADSVGSVVKRSLGLASAPAPLDGPKTLPQWDSLGGLRLLLALEDAFGVVLSEDDVLRVATVGDLTGIVARAVARVGDAPEHTSLRAGNP
jgi:acetyltransferase-like isoleucine patch superfamily enzyme/acyl carrier protein